MTKRELNSEFEAIIPSEGKKEAVWGNIENELNNKNISNTFSKRRNWRRLSRVVAAAAVALCVLAVPATVFADEIKDFFHGILSKQEGTATKDLNVNVFEDENEHMRMQVRELLTDGTYAMTFLTYEALDDYGKEWLSHANEGFGFLTKEEAKQQENLWMTPEEIDDYAARFNIKKGHTNNDELCDKTIYNNGIGYFGLTDGEESANSDNYYYYQYENNIRSNFSEKEEYTTDTTRCYYALYRAYMGPNVQGTTNNNQCELIYLLPGEAPKRVLLDAKQAETYTYRLSGRAYANGQMLPCQIELSALTLRVDAYNRTLATIAADPNYKFDTLPRTPKSLVLHFEDGTSMERHIEGTYWGGEIGKNNLCQLLTTTFRAYDAETDLVITPYGTSTEIPTKYFDDVYPRRLAGIEINGIYYKATMIDDSERITGDYDVDFPR